MQQLRLTLIGAAFLLLGCADSVELLTTSELKPDAQTSHAHDEESLGTHQIGDLAVALAQGHGPIEAGKESHLVVKLPYSDGGASVVRAWIGSHDRLLSLVGKGQYAASHDDYEVHATAPNLLAEDAMWWIEVVKPDGSTHVGRVDPVR